MAKRKHKDRAIAVAQNMSAPNAERYDAQVSLQKSLGPAGAGDLIPNAQIAPIIDHIASLWDERMLTKAISDNPVPFPSKNQGKEGMQSVTVDEYQLVAQGAYYDPPSVISPYAMRGLVEGMPIINSIILTRVRQVEQFCRPQMSHAEIGFVIAHVDENVELTADHKNKVQLIQQFVINSGWEFDPRRRKRLKRDTFSALMAKVVRDTLTLDAIAIETEWKRNAKLGLDGLYAVDGATIRLCTEAGYDGDDEIFALQVVGDRIRTAYTYEDLIYEIRNPRSDVTIAGYGYSETEMLVRVVTYMLNAMTFNGSYFDKNSIPRGILNLYGNYSPEDIAAFKRYWSAMVKGIENRHNMPVMVSKDNESAAQFVEIGGQLDEMQFAKWLQFLTSVACAVYSIAPEEISMESFSSGKSSLSGSDTEEKITLSKDKGLGSLLGKIENTYSDYIIQTFDPNLNLRFMGLNGEDADKRFEMRKLVATFNEGRRDIGLSKVEGPMGDAPINPALLGVWQQIEGIGQPAPQEAGDFGEPPEDDESAEPPDDQQGDADSMDDGADAGGGSGGSPMSKAFGFPGASCFRIEK